jgi:hypothetical protein
MPKSESKSELLYDWHFTANPFILATSPLRHTTSIFLAEHLRLSSLCNIVSDERMCLSQLLLALAIVVILMTTFYCLRFETSSTWRARYISPKNRVAQLYPQGTKFLFVASYDSQGYGGGIRPRLHTV